MNHIETLVSEYKKAKEFATKVTERADELKKELVKLVKESGKPDNKGHLWLDAGDNQVKHERRVSRSLDQSAAIDWAKNNGVWDEVKEVIEVLSEDALLKFFWENPDRSKELEEMYSEKESWAFKIVERKNYDDDDE